MEAISGCDSSGSLDHDEAPAQAGVGIDGLHRAKEMTGRHPLRRTPRRGRDR